jgi:hypothetical protein
LIFVFFKVTTITILHNKQHSIFLEKTFLKFTNMLMLDWLHKLYLCLCFYSFFDLMRIKIRFLSAIQFWLTFFIFIFFTSD